MSVNITDLHDSVSSEQTEARVTTKHCTMHRRVPIAEDYLAPNVNGAEDEKP